MSSIISASSPPLEESISSSFSLIILSFLDFFSSVLGIGPALYFSLINVFTRTLLLLVEILRLGGASELRIDAFLLYGDRGFENDNKLFSSSIVYLS